MSALSSFRITGASAIVPFGLLLVIVGGLSEDASAQSDESTVVESVGVAVAVTNISDIEASLLTGKLGEALTRSFDVKVVAGDAAATKLPKGLPDGCIADIDCLRASAKALRVDRLLMLVAFRVGEEIQVDATHFSVANDVSEARPAMRISALPSEWDPVFQEAAPSLLPGLTAKSRPGDGDDDGDGDGGGDPVGPVAPPEKKGGLPLSVKVVGGVAILTTAIASGFGVAVVLDCGFSRRCEDGGTSGHQKVADIVGIGGAVLVVATVVLYFTVDRDPASQDGLSLRTGPGDVGFAIGHSF